jgi:hypothetical protein
VHQEARREGQHHRPQPASRLVVSIICIIWALCAKATSKQLDQVHLIAAAMVAAQNGQILTAAPVVPRVPKAQPEVRDWVKALGIVKAQPEPVA